MGMTNGWFLGSLILMLGGALSVLSVILIPVYGIQPDSFLWNLPIVIAMLVSGLGLIVMVVFNRSAENV